MTSNARARKFWYERKTPCSLPTDIENLTAEFEQVRAEGENAGLEKAKKIALSLAEGKEYDLECKAYNDGCHAVAEAIRAAKSPVAQGGE